MGGFELNADEWGLWETTHTDATSGQYTRSLSDIRWDPKRGDREPHEHELVPRLKVGESQLSNLKLTGLNTMTQLADFGLSETVKRYVVFYFLSNISFFALMGQLMFHSFILKPSKHIPLASSLYPYIFPE